MPDIYQQFDTATAQVGAYAIFNGADYIGRVVFKYPRDGAGRLTCYAQVWGGPMQRGSASGGGYDKRTAAFEAAVAKLVDPTGDPRFGEHVQHWRDAAAAPEGERWSRRLEDRGYTVACVAD